MSDILHVRLNHDLKVFVDQALEAEPDRYANKTDLVKSALYDALYVFYDRNPDLLANSGSPSLIRRVFRRQQDQEKSIRELEEAADRYYDSLIV